MQVRAIKTKVFKENEDLIVFISRYIKKLPEKSVLVVTSKIVALSEGRVVVAKNEKEKEAIIRAESSFAMKTKYTWLTIKDGMVLASAGVDESNADGKIILLPKDSFKSAEYIRNIFKKKFKIKNLGVVITDSRLLPLRAGVVGVALGYAGFKGVRNYIGLPDIFGRPLKMTQTDIADAIATSAVLLMGEGSECQPLALISDAPIVFTDEVNKKELMIDPKEDVYAPLFKKLKN